MRTFGICALCGLLAFVAVQYQMTGGLLGMHTPEAPPPPPPPPPKLKFPEGLAVLSRGTGVPQAAAFNKSAENHPLVTLKANGTLHIWQDRLQPDWKAESVEETELAIIMPSQKRTLLQTATYASGAPPLKRYQYDLDVRVLEARTGKPLGYKHFQTVARPIRPLENWAMTELGDPVSWREVNQWVRELTVRASGQAR